MNALGEGRLSITIHAKNAVYNQVSGYIVPRFTCDIFDSVLSTIDEDVATSSKTYDFGAKIVTFSTGNDIFLLLLCLSTTPLRTKVRKFPFRFRGYLTSSLRSLGVLRGSRRCLDANGKIWSHQILSQSSGTAA